MELGYEMVNNTLIVKFHGELDHHVAESIRTELDDAISQHRVKNLIFDLSGMGFMDSSGIGVIIGRYKSISKLGGKVSVIHVTDQIDKIFSLAGIYNIISKYNNKSEALNRM